MISKQDPRASSQFGFPVPQEDLSFTGERYTSTITGPIRHEHHHRYLVATHYCAGCDVLDVACGEGYGSALLGRVARSVLGVDLDAQTVAFARRNYGSPHVVFQCGDAANLEHEPNSFDVVVSFETIEHLIDHEGFLAGVHRVLRPGGMFIISSPDREIYTEADHHENKFHLNELDRREFKTLLEKSFAHVLVFEQEAIIGSVIGPEGGEPASWCTFSTQDGQVYDATDGAPRAHYLFALASDGPLAPGKLSLLQDLAYARGAQQRELNAAAIAREVIVRDAEIARLNGELSGTSAGIAELERTHQIAAARSAQVQNELFAALAVTKVHSAKAEHELFEALAASEIRSAKAERELERLNSMVAAIERRLAEEAIYSQRSFIGRRLFRRNGRPIRGLRRVLFHNSGKVRGIFRSFVVSENGLLRKPLERWMMSDEYLALPKARRWRKAELSITNRPNPAFPPTPIFSDHNNILIIDGAYPTPDRDSGSIDSINFVKIFLHMGYNVYFISTSTLLSPTYSAIEDDAKRRLESLGVVVVENKHMQGINEFIHSYGKFFQLFFLSRVYSGGQFIDAIRAQFKSAKVIFNAVDLHFVRELRQGELEQDSGKIKAAMCTREQELYLVRQADATIVVSVEEVKIIEKEAPGALVYEIPLIREVSGCNTEFLSRRHIGFIGGFKHPPNTDAIRYFLHSIWPLVRKELPDLKFYLMGADIPEELSQRKDPGLVVLGHVVNLGEVFECLRLTVAPLRYGAGAKGKVVSSLSHGIPCIGTSIAAEGMGLDETRGVLVADNAEDFAKLVVRAYTDEDLWKRLSNGGLSRMRERHSFDAGVDRMTIVMRGLSLYPSTGRPQ
jgi:SAM-dependent methyltransferase/glycosyltransferase involved in cell wall biosynthesis